jgi:hypothetical protein
MLATRRTRREIADTLAGKGYVRDDPRVALTKLKGEH